AAARRENGGAAHVRVENRERESHAYAVVSGTTGACTGGYCARTAQRRRTQPSGRNQRTDERSVHRRAPAVCYATEWDADVEHPDAGARSDGAAEKERVSKVLKLCADSWLGSAHLPILSGQPANS